MSMQNSHTLIRATCCRIRIWSSSGKVRRLSSCETFPTHDPKASGIRAEWTLSGVRTWPKRRRAMAYTSFIMRPLGRSMGGRYGVSMKSSCWCQPCDQRERPVVTVRSALRECLQLVRICDDVDALDALAPDLEDHRRLRRLPRIRDQARPAVQRRGPEHNAIGNQPAHGVQNDFGDGHAPVH